MRENIISSFHYCQLSIFLTVDGVKKEIPLSVTAFREKTGTVLGGEPSSGDKEKNEETQEENNEEKDQEKSEGKAEE